MKVKVRTSKSESISQLIKELTENIEKPKLILYFSPEEKFNSVTEELVKAFPDSTSMGTTTKNTFTNFNSNTNQIQATYFFDDIECAGNVIPDIKSFPLKYAQRIQDSIMSLSSTDNTICLSFTTAFSNSEELVITALDTVCAEHSITVAGGTSGIKNEEGEKSYVSLNGKIYQDSAVYMCIRNLTGKIKVFKENVFVPTKEQFLANQVDIKNRSIIELNQKPSALVLSEALQVPVSELKTNLQEKPLGRIANNEIYICSIEEILKDNSTIWGSRIYSNTKVNLLKLGDYKSITENTINKIKNTISNPSHVMMIHCDGRRLIYEKYGFYQEFISTYSSAFPSISGFSSHGEQLGKMHLNFTLLLIVFE